MRIRSSTPVSCLPTSTHFCRSLSSAEALSIGRVVIEPGVISTVIIPIYSLVEPSQGEGGTFVTRLRESATFWPEDDYVQSKMPSYGTLEICFAFGMINESSQPNTPSLTQFRF